MTDSELFASLPRERAIALLGEFRTARKAALQTVASHLATRRKLRPVFIEKKPLPERLDWMARELSRKSNADMAIEVLHTWLMVCRQPMLRLFLDALGIAHNGEGVIESAPGEPPADKVDAAVDALLTAFPAEEAALYLRLFLRMDPDGWPHLNGIVAADPRLCMAQPTVPSIIPPTTQPIAQS